MKLKSLKFVLPILLVLPSLAFAGYHYWRTPEGTEITSPVTLHFDFEDWDFDVCDGDYLCREVGQYWRFVLRSSSDNYFYGEIHSKTTNEATENFNLPVGTEITRISIWVLDESQHYLRAKEMEFCDPNYCFIITGISTPPSSEMIGNTQNWLSSNEILGYIGKLAEDIPNYIALMMGLPIAFWFVEKIIAFVRGNFRPAEKIKEE
jgi:hypothetical protein